MNGFELRAANIKQRIMKTTLSLMQKETIKQIKIADIAKQAGVSQVTIYNYFGSKGTLIRESYKNYLMNTMADFEQYIEANHSFKELIEYIVLNKQSAQTLIASGLGEELMQKDEELYHFIENEYKARAIPLLVKLLEEGKRSGEVSPNLTVPVFIVYMQIFLSGTRQVLEAAMKTNELDQFAKELTHIFFYGICGKEG